MPANWNIILSIENSSAIAFEAGGRRRELIVRRSALARRMRLSVDPRDGNVKLSLPRRAGLRHALEWVEERRDWVEAELARLPPPTPILPGETIPIEGEPHIIDWRAELSRTVRREPGRLIIGGPPDLLQARILRWFRKEALAVLVRDTEEMASKAGVSIGRVSIGDPMSRWASCSSKGDIRYSWRLILMPPDVRRAIVAHEVAHRIHMNHGAAFHATEAMLFGREPKAETRWLRSNSARIHALGRDG